MDSDTFPVDKPGGLDYHRFNITTEHGTGRAGSDLRGGNGVRIPS